MKFVKCQNVKREMKDNDNINNNKKTNRKDHVYTSKLRARKQRKDMRLDGERGNAA